MKLSETRTVGEGSRGFSLIELLVVVAIAALLMSMGYSALSGGRMASKEAICRGNLKQIAVGLNLYYNQHKAYPSDALPENQGRVGSPRETPGSRPAGARAGSPSLYVCPIAIETDWQLNQVFGGDLQAEVAYVTSLLTWTSYRYEEQIGTVLTYPYVQFYTTPGDPWHTPDVGGYLSCIDLLYEFQAAWGTKLPPTPGLTICEMMDAACEGRVKAMVLMGENPMLSEPDITHAEKAMRHLEFLVVQDIFLSETAALADVVLPVASFAEKEGTFTNTERRVQRVHTVTAAPGSARVDWQILCDLSRRLGYDMDYADAAAIEDEIAAVSPIYGGITYDRLDQAPLQWPCPDKGHPGTPYLHKGEFKRGKGKFHPVEFLPARELPDDAYPLLLTTGRLLQHFHTGTMSRRARVLDELVPSGVVEIHPGDAARLGVSDGQKVTVSSRRGQIEIAAWVTDSMRPGTVFIPFHFHEAPANRLTIAALDPIAKIPELKVCAVKIEPLA